jgi:hypothetical protein
MLPAGSLEGADELLWSKGRELVAHPLTATRSRLTEGGDQPRSRMVAR